MKRDLLRNSLGLEKRAIFKHICCKILRAYGGEDIRSKNFAAKMLKRVVLTSGWNYARGLIPHVLLLFVLAFIGCQSQGPKTNSDTLWRKENGKVKVLSTIAMIDDIVCKIGGEHVDAIALIKGELDPHTYELVKGDDEKFARADLIFFNGLGLEHGLSLREHLEGNQKAIALGNWILEKDPAHILMTNGQHDPHIWMDISLWARIIDPIVTALMQRDPLHASEYRQRGDLLYEQMLAADVEAYQKLQRIDPIKRYLVTSHNAFHYFTRRYLASQDELQEERWRIRFQAPEGLAPDAQLSVTDIQAIIDYVEKYQVKVLFPESNINKDALKKIVSASREKGIELRLCPRFLYADAMGKEPSYLKMITHNVEVIAAEFVE